MSLLLYLVQNWPENDKLKIIWIKIESQYCIICLWMKMFWWLPSGCKSVIKYKEHFLDNPGGCGVPKNIHTPPLGFFSGLTPTWLGFTLQRASCYTLHIRHGHTFHEWTFILFNFNLVTNQPNEILPVCHRRPLLQIRRDKLWHWNYRLC